VDYYESVVVQYLRADRALFVNTECCIQLNEAANPDSSGPHWYCDAVACDFRNQVILLCAISFSAQLSDLSKRLKGWHGNWDFVCQALARDSDVPNECLCVPGCSCCHLGLGKLSRRTGKREQAQEHLTTAATMYRDMDMTFWLEGAKAEINVLWSDALGA
jgi:hypothetical protein